MSIIVNSITSFSNRPLIIIFYIGVAIFIVAITYTAYVVGSWFLFEKPMSGWTSVMASIWILGGMIISFLGILGVYLSKVFTETKQRPYTIVRHVYNKGSLSHGNQRGSRF